MKIEATVNNYNHELKGEEFIRGEYYGYADFFVTITTYDERKIELFIQPSFDPDGYVASMYGGAESEGDVELINPDLEDEIVEAMQKALDEYEKED